MMMFDLPLPLACPPKVDVLIIDDHILLLEAMSAVIRSGSEFEVDGVCNVGEALTKIEERGRYKVVLLDYQLPGVEGLVALRSLVKANDGGVTLFSGVAGWTIAENAISQGASGFIPKTTTIKTLLHAIRFIADGEVYLPFEYLRRTAGDEKDKLGFRPRELQVLAYLCEGMQNKEIGREVGIEEVIVKMDVKAICRKLGVRNRTEAALASRARGFF